MFPNQEQVEFEKTTILFELLTLFAKNPNQTFVQLNSQIEIKLDQLEKNSNAIDVLQNTYCKRLKK
jgi:hypothetical protein